MTQCDIIPLTTKACSGKCKGGGGCAKTPIVWVLAACGGMTALFQKQSDGHLTPLKNEIGTSLFADTLRDRLTSASEHGDFSQLVLVGSANDISWTQASLPSSVSKQVVAEIEYPLMSGWFSTPSDMGRLTQALENVFQS